MAQYQHLPISDNVKRSVKNKLDKGEWIGRAPLGYINAVDADTGQSTVILDKERAFLVKNLFKEYATGTVSLHELQRKANGWGLTTLKGNRILVQTLHKLIHNPFYYGMMQVKEQLYPHSYPPLIDKALFDACQSVGRTPRTDAPRETENAYILRGMSSAPHQAAPCPATLKRANLSI